ncbi:MAG TPA: hypothetical protein VHY32_06390 [Caulobacteraceae bacterium]|jgi:hypothetical protein|nr:hypothetical protein [Caulobacteraceae bacterium]
MRSRSTFAALSALILICAAGPAAAARHIYSYDSATPATTLMTEAGLSFIFDKSLMGVTVRQLMETQDIGAADLKPVSEGALGRGGVDAAVGPDAREHDLYEITDQADGKALRGALCRGADHVWLAFGRIKFGQDLRIRALGHDPASGKTRLCVTLDYTFRGEWALPQPLLPQPDRTDRFNDAPNRLPY